MKTEIGFKQYLYKGNPVIGHKCTAMEDTQMFVVNTNHMFLRLPPPDTRSKCRKVYDEIRHRLSNAWYMLKGGDFE